MRIRKIIASVACLLAALSVTFMTATPGNAATSAADMKVAQLVSVEIANYGGTQVAANKVEHQGYSATVIPESGAIPSCSYGHLCVYNPGNNTVYDYYKCGTYATAYLSGDGTFNNNQTAGTVARFYNQNGSLRWRSTAHQTGTASWTPVWSIRPC